ncbi:conserved exported hypothetical protein [Vibrio nigripulchritudo MADA3029]|uniref:DUF6795 domain-containing protein n=1 Tax=Vibrio nigripulchritudo TaxID=28173 RepID=UPI0003B1A24E|nr:DUF6795 domain-containing protein [Vibrio nigripulchritudo]CCN47561.1 conserved exported hypothetical protein [Vibrio nigripulchritudo MADA3020]CCN55969.1 conserved exported hypothetical protein [Vibrio nigripulchritudo MADA3021]CCN57191.1 conserved exported hypothetical protein [Vibrio nigripulchritudo MADA3029]
MKLSIKFILVIGLLLVGGSKLFEKEIYELTPEVRGTLTQDGSPMIAQSVEIQVGALGEINKYQTETDGNGQFYFAPISEKKLMKPSFLDQKYVGIALTTTLDDNKKITLWESTISGYKLQEFVKENMAELKCDVSTPLKYYIFSKDENNNDDYYVYSHCQLKGYTDSGLDED